jgi:phospholipase/carboxylesterase
VIDAFIDDQLAHHGLDDSQLVLVGFSQGTMMSLFVALRRSRPVAGVLGYSGALIGEETLSDELVARPPIMLVHGDADDLVPVEAMHSAVGALGEAGVAVEWHVCPGVGHGIDPRGLTLGNGFVGACLTPT